MHLHRKIEDKLIEWKEDKTHLPLIIKGARQIGKTESIREFGKSQYKVFIEINFALQKEYKDIFDDGFEVDTIIRNISFHNNDISFYPKETLVFFDELQECPNAATALKSFREDGGYDVICSGSLMGINYQEIESNSVGNKQDITMYPMDFEEFLWASGYRIEQIEDLYSSMVCIKPLGNAVFNVIMKRFGEYMVIGGMPAVVRSFIETGTYSGILGMQRQLILDYEEDITKYAIGLDKTKVLQMYRAISVFLGRDNKKFQVSKVRKNARNRDYTGVADWLKNAGIVNICYNMHLAQLPIKGNYDYYNYKMYFGDTGLLIASLDDEAQDDLRNNRNFNAYKGAIYENIVAQMLVVQGYETVFYRNEKGTVEMDFMLRDKNSLIPLEVKAVNGATKSLNRLIDDEKYKDIHYGIKLCGNNVGFNGKFYVFPYFFGIFLKRFLKEKS